MADAFRALISDDDRDLLSLIRRTLEFTAGWEVHTALSGAAGIELARVVSPNVILIDVMMPEIDGYEVARYARDNPATREVPIIFLTAMNSSEDNILRGYGAGAVDMPIHDAWFQAHGYRRVAGDPTAGYGVLEYVPAG